MYKPQIVFQNLSKTFVHNFILEVLDICVNLHQKQFLQIMYHLNVWICWWDFSAPNGDISNIQNCWSAVKGIIGLEFRGKHRDTFFGVSTIYMGR